MQKKDFANAVCSEGLSKKKHHKRHLFKASYVYVVAVVVVVMAWRKTSVEEF